MDKPDGLGDAGSAFFDDIAGKYELRPDEQRILVNACRTLDDIFRLEEALSGAELVVRGSRGQPAAHPLLAELARSRSMLARLLKQLDLPDEGGVPAHGSALSEKRRAAANARWSRVRAQRAAAQQGMA
jgi:hypothetical protein